MTTTKTQATAGNPLNPMPGDIVGVLTRGGRVVDCVVTSVRGIRKGRRAGLREYTVAPCEDSKAIAFRCTGTSFFRPAKALHSASEAHAASNKLQAAQTTVFEKKQERAEAGRAAIGDVDWRAMRADPFAAPGGSNIKPGDTVTVRYTNCTRDEVVAKVNFATGKIAIVARHNRSGVRWLPATVVTAARAPERALPCELNAERQAKLERDGWFQVTFSNGEFITSSYVVAKTREDAARKGQTYDCASSTVYLDPTSKLYHRATGSFD